MACQRKRAKPRQNSPPKKVHQDHSTGLHGQWPLQRLELLHVFYGLSNATCEGSSTNVLLGEQRQNSPCMQMMRFSMTAASGM